MITAVVANSDKHSPLLSKQELLHKKESKKTEHSEFMANATSLLQPENSRWIRGKLIGKGSFGAVSVGFDPFDGRVFAVKSVEVNSASVAQLDAIENEISILRSLSSPFVVDYHADDTTAAPELVYRNLHVEYLPGGTAAETSAACTDEDLVRRYTWCLTSALTYVHSRGIVHCDVKGKNVLLGPTPGTAKLADFGSAKREEDDRRDRIAPRGSPLWMAPEVVRGEFQGYESDVWALGCTLIEMLTSGPAWHDDGAKTLRRIGYSDELPQFPARLSDLGKDFLEKCLRRDPTKRWSCDQLLQHPFLQLESTVEIEESCSPRSVIGWPRSKVSDDEAETEEEEFTRGSDAGSRVGCGVSSAEERIGKLAGPAGANWESDGWVAVRGIFVEVKGQEVEESGVSCGCNEEAGTSSENSECLGADVEFHTFARVNLSGGSSGGGLFQNGFCGGDLAAGEESETCRITAEKENIPVVCGEYLLCIILSILYYTNYLSYHYDTSNIPALISVLTINIRTEL